MVPLSKQALHTLRLLQKISGSHSSGYVFPGTQGAATMSNMTLLQMFGKGMGYGKKMTGHGWRSVASTILNENNFNRDWIEMALACMLRKVSDTHTTKPSTYHRDATCCSGTEITWIHCALAK